MAGSRADELEAALQAAFRPPPADEFGSPSSIFEIPRTFELFSHRFGVGPADVIERSDDRYTLAGKLTHAHQSDSGGDEIAWRIVRTRQSIVSATWQLNGGPSRPLATGMMQALNQFRAGRELDGDQQRAERDAAETALRKAVDSSWQSAAQFLIARIAIGGGC
jgi:hypothetical protein